MPPDFEEISHSGGEVRFAIRRESGRLSYQVQYSTSRPVPVNLITVLALHQGIPVAMEGDRFPSHFRLPNSETIPVLIASDSEGRFGHLCPVCNGYWRSGPIASFCAYCGQRRFAHQFLSEAQRRYIKRYCDVLLEALHTESETEAVIDMSAVADASDRQGERPSFYVSEQSQQHKFDCRYCNEFNDILGRFGYCSRCGTRNDLTSYRDTIIPAIRDRLRAGGPPEGSLRDGVGSFDSLVGQYARQLAKRMPMTDRRRVELQGRRFHDLRRVHKLFEDWFDIDLLKDMNEGNRRLVSRLFLRRHVYEHNFGVVDQAYLDESGDTTVRLGQHIREESEEIHRLLGALLKMAGNLHEGFHALFPPSNR